MTRDNGLKMVTEYEGRRPPSLQIFLEYVGLTEEEFMEVSMSHAVSPYRHDPSGEGLGRRTHDFDEWFKREPMARDETLRQLNRWRKVNGRTFQKARRAT
jgi:hypothetical protein